MLKLWLEGKPTSWNAYYAGRHWTQRAQEAHRIHALVRYALGAEPPRFSVPVSITLTAYTQRPVDADNIAAKLYIDGLVQAGVLVDDSPRYVVSVTTRSRRAGQGSRPGVEVLIEEAENENLNPR